MIGFEKENDTLLSQVQRGEFQIYADTSKASLYIPPPIELYTYISLKAYFIIFCVLLLIQTLVIFLLDYFWLKCLPKNASMLERILHAHLKSHFPFPYSDWDAEKGTCNDLLKRQKSAQQEVTITTLVNLVFALLMTFPLVLLCKFETCKAFLTQIKIHLCKIGFDYRY